MSHPKTDFDETEGPLKSLWKLWHRLFPTTASSSTEPPAVIITIMNYLKHFILILLGLFKFAEAAKPFVDPTIDLSDHEKAEGGESAERFDEAVKHLRKVAPDRAGQACKLWRSAEQADGEASHEAHQNLEARLNEWLLDADLTDVAARYTAIDAKLDALQQTDDVLKAACSSFQLEKNRARIGQLDAELTRMDAGVPSRPGSLSPSRDELMEDLMNTTEAQQQLTEQMAALGISCARISPLYKKLGALHAEMQTHKMAQCPMPRAKELYHLKSQHLQAYALRSSPDCSDKIDRLQQGLAHFKAETSRNR